MALIIFIYYHYNHIFCLHNISDRSIKALGISELDSYVQTLIEYMKLQKKKVLQEQIINIAKYYRDFKWDLGGKVALDKETRKLLVIFETAH